VLDRQSQEVVDVALVEEVLGVAVVGAQGAARQGGRRDHGQQVDKVFGSRTLAKKNPHPAAQLLHRLVGGQALVVRTDPAGDVGIEPPASESRSMAVHRPPGECVELGVDLRIAEHRSRNVHHLGQPQHPRLAGQGCEIRRRQTGAGGRKIGGRYTGWCHDQHVEREVGGGGEHPAHAVKTRNVGNLVRVAHHRRGPTRDDRARELGRDHHAALQVNMGVNQTRQQQSTAEINPLPGVAGLTHGSNDAVHDRH